VSKSAKSHNFRETRSPGNATITNNVDGGMTEFFNQGRAAAARLTRPFAVEGTPLRRARMRNGTKRLTHRGTWRESLS
jgi:hypothetical protein